MWKRPLLPAIAIALLVVGSAQAHFIWIERDGEGPARAYCGEGADNLREKTAGDHRPHPLGRALCVGSRLCR